MEIENDDQHRVLLDELDILMGRSPTLHSDEGKRLSAIAVAIDAYESEKFKFEKPTAEEAAKFRAVESGDEIHTEELYNFDDLITGEHLQLLKKKVKTLEEVDKAASFNSVKNRIEKALYSASRIGLELDKAGFTDKCDLQTEKEHCLCCSYSIVVSVPRSSLVKRSSECVVPVMRDSPSVSPIRRRYQTTISCGC